MKPSVIAAKCMQNKRMTLPVVIFVLLLISVQPAIAGRFMLLTEAETFPKGLGEFVQVGSWQESNGVPESISTTNLQIGLEFGIASRVHVGMALPAVANESGPGGHHTRFGGTGMWAVYNAVKPSPNQLGVSFGVGVAEWNDNLSVDGSVILEESWNQWLLVTNLSAGRAWIRDGSEGDHGFLIHRLGISCEVNGSVSLAVEAEWNLSHRGGFTYQTDGVKVGPAVVWNGRRLWLLGGLLFELNDGSEQEGAALQFQAGLAF